MGSDRTGACEMFAKSVGGRVKRFGSFSFSTFRCLAGFQGWFGTPRPRYARREGGRGRRISEDAMRREHRRPSILLRGVLVHASVAAADVLQNVVIKASEGFL